MTTVVIIEMMMLSGLYNCCSVGQVFSVRILPFFMIKTFLFFFFFFKKKKKFLIKKREKT